MRFATDENFDGRILDGLRRRIPTLDVVHVQDIEMYQQSDLALLNWLAHEGRNFAHARCKNHSGLCLRTPALRIARTWYH